MNQSRESSLGDSRGERDSRQLVALLKGVIREQEFKIAELETDLKRWEKKYKEEFFREARKHDCDHQRQLKENQEMILTFSGDLLFLQDKYERGAIREQPDTPEVILKGGVLQLEALYSRVETLKQEITRKDQQIQQKSVQLQSVKQKQEGCLREYEEVVGRSQAYEQKLLEQIKRQRGLLLQHMQ